MHIDRELIKNTYQAYISPYDLSDDKIRLKAGHIYRVADNADLIARSIGLPQEEIDLAWLIGMLHDFGRFEQLRRYNTFIDSESVDHAELGADLLFGGPLDGDDPLHGGIKTNIRDFISDSTDDLIIEKAIRYHSALKIPSDLTEREQLHCEIIRDADKIDIYRVNIDFPLESIYNTTTEILKSCTVSEDTLEDFYAHHCVTRAHRHTPVDHVVGHIALTYELVYPISLKLVKEQGYMGQLMNFNSKNPVTQKQFELIRKEMKAFIGG